MACLKVRYFKDVETNKYLESIGAEFSPSIKDLHVSLNIKSLPLALPQNAIIRNVNQLVYSVFDYGFYQGEFAGREEYKQELIEQYTNKLPQ